MSTTGIPLGAASVSSQDLAQSRGTQAQRVLQSKTTDSAKIDKAARDFESILIGEWLEKAEKSFASVPGVDKDPDQDAGHDQFQSISCQFLAEALSKSGGIGIASMISKHLKAVEATRQDSENSPKVTSEVTGNIPRTNVSGSK